MESYRMEHDLLGKKEVPAGRYYGIQTLRAVENFSITGIPISHYPHLIASLAYIKKAAALANTELGLLPGDISGAMCKACDEILAGKYLDEFVVDVIQGGAGTSTNMNLTNDVAGHFTRLARTVLS